MSANPMEPCRHVDEPVIARLEWRGNSDGWHPELTIRESGGLDVTRKGYHYLVECGAEEKVGVTQRLSAVCSRLSEANQTGNSYYLEMEGYSAWVWREVDVELVVGAMLPEDINERSQILSDFRQWITYVREEMETVSGVGPRKGEK